MILKFLRMLKSVNSLFILLALYSTLLSSQNPIKDQLTMLSHSDVLQYHSHYGSTNTQNTKTILNTKKTSKIAKYNPISLLLKGGMAFYQNLVSPQLGNRCIYDLSCSNFSKASIAEFGMVKGLFLSADRLLRCNRISTLDFIPPKINPKTGKYNDLPIFYKVKNKGNL